MLLTALVSVGIRRSNGRVVWCKVFAKIIGDTCVFPYKGRMIYAMA